MLTNQAIATFNADFSATKQFKAVIDPSPQVNQRFKIRVYCPRPVQILSFYGDVGAAVIEVDLVKTEFVALNSQPEYPIKQLISARLSTHGIDEQARELVYFANSTLPDVENENLVGSVKFEYFTFDAQVFNHPAISTPGNCIIWFYDDNGCFFPVPFLVAEDETTQDLTEITIEGHDRNLANGAYNSYTFRVHPISGVAIKTNAGLIESAGSQLVVIQESASFNNSDTAELKHFISGWVETPDYASGFFLDDNGNEVAPSVSIQNGKVKLSRVVSVGVIPLVYYATFNLFNLFRAKDGNTFLRSTIVGFRKADKAIAVYHIPIPTDMGSPKQRVFRIFRKMLVADKRYEMPTTYNETTISYASYPAADITFGYKEAYEDEKTQVEVYYDSVSCWASDNEGMFDWAYPSPDAVTSFADIAWQTEENIPNDLDGFAVGMIQAEIQRVKTKYGVA